MLKFNQLTPEMTDAFDFLALVSNMETRPTKTGKDYLQFDLVSKEGVISGKKWTITPADKEIKNGTVVQATGTINMWQGSMSIIIKEWKAVEIDPTEFQLTAIEKFDLIKQEFEDYIKTLRNPGCIALVDMVLNIPEVQERFFKWPAAKANHHAEENGLLYHTTRMLRAADALMPVYNHGGKNVLNRDIVMTGIILHDIGKCYELEPDDSGAGHYTKYALLGHIPLGFAEIVKAHERELIDDEMYIVLGNVVLGHHGQLEYGSPVKPATADAILVSYIDNLDATLMAYETECLRLQPGERAEKTNMSVGTPAYKPLPLE